MPQIPQGTVDTVRESSDILEVISQYVDLKQRGSNYFGICPFHDEKTPSFSVAPSKQIYHCFGCNSGGNVFSFIMEYQKTSFPEAVKFVADRYNIKIEFEKMIFNQKRLQVFMNYIILLCRCIRIIFFPKKGVALLIIYMNVDLVKI